MKIFAKALLVIVSGAIMVPDVIYGRDVRTIVQRLEALGHTAIDASYEVLLPAADDPIVYTVRIDAEPAAGDPLHHTDYLIDWTLHAPGGASHGFAAYRGGHHYRYRDNRIQEYHYEWDSIPFITAHGGVQGNAQFADLTPRALAAQLRAMCADSTWTLRMHTDTLVSRRRADVILGTQNVAGYDCRHITWILEPDTSLPRLIEVESNPASISEQTVTVRFRDIDTAGRMPDVSEAGLIARYPDEFAECRESNFAIINMPGKPLPTFSCPTPTGERYTHHRGEPFAAPTVIWLLDPGTACTPQVIADTRAAIDTLPMTADVVWAFVSNDTDAIDSIIDRPRPGEAIVMSARSLARDTGVTAYPTALAVNAGGVVTDVILGSNKSLVQNVIHVLTSALASVRQSDAQ